MNRTCGVHYEVTGRVEVSGGRIEALKVEFCLYTQNTHATCQ